MSFTNTNPDSINYISPRCYFLLSKSKLSLGNSSNILGDISAIDNINTFDPAFNQTPNSIITNYNSGNSTQFIVGLPNKNGNNLSKKDIITAMNFYNINLLRNIRPYVKLAGNDTTIELFSEKNVGNVTVLNRNQVTSIILKLGLQKRFCLSTGIYSL